MFGFDPRFQFVHEDDVIRSILFVLRPRPARRLQRRRRRAAALVRGRGDLRQAHRCRCPPFGNGAAGRTPAPAGHRTCPRSTSTCCATGAGSTTDASRRPASATTTRSAEAVEAFVEAVRLRRTVGGDRARVPLRARRRAVLPALTRGAGATSPAPELPTDRLARCHAHRPTQRRPPGWPTTRSAPRRAQRPRRRAVGAHPVPEERTQAAANPSASSATRA